MSAHAGHRRIRLAAVLVLFLATAGAWSVVVPVFGAPDEPFHFDYIRFLATRGVLPDPTRPERRISTEGFNPPLYYALAAVGLRVVSSDAAAGIRIHEPRDAARAVRDPDAASRTGPYPPLNPRYIKWGVGRERNMFLTTAADRFPFEGPIRAVHLLRGLSVWMGMLTVYFVWRTAEVAFPDRPGVPLLAASLCAFNPQFAFISGSLNNDNLVTLLSSAAIFATTRILAREGAPGPAVWGLGVVLGLSLLAKLNALAVAGAAVAALLLRAARSAERPARRCARVLVAAGLPMLAVSGWFFARNVRLYGWSDPLGLRLRAELHPGLVLPAEAVDHFFGEIFLRRFFTSFWGRFDWLTVPLPDTAYAAYGALMVVGAAGAVAFLRDEATPRQRECAAFWAASLLLAVLALVSLNRIFRSAQGRLVFPAIAASSTLLAIGIETAVCTLLGGRPRAARAVLGAVPVALLLGCGWTLVSIIHPLYH